MENETLKSPFLYGEYELTVDDKNRVSCPAEIRRRLDPSEHGEALFVIIGTNKVPWFYPDRYYEELVAAEVKPTLNPSAAKLATDHINFALANRLEWDKQGRILIPEKYLTRCGVGRDVTMIGMGDHLQLHNRDAWNKYRDELLGSR